MDQMYADAAEHVGPVSSRGNINANPHEARKLSVLRCILSLNHACQCRDTNCQQFECQKMKKVIAHKKNCKQKTNCPICKQLITVCCYHAKHCHETECLMPFCCNIKHKLKEHKLQKSLQEARLRGRMAVMNTKPIGPVSGMGGGQQPSNALVAADVAMNQGVSLMNLPPLHQSGIGLESATQTVPTHVRHVLKEVEETTARSKAPRWDFMTQRMAAMNFRPIEPVNAFVTAGVTMNPGTSSANLPPPYQPEIHLAPSARTPSAYVLQVVKQTHKAARVLEQLEQSLKSLSTPEEQNEILQILNGNPPLMAALIKQREQDTGQNGGHVGPMIPNQLQQQQQQEPGPSGIGMDLQTARQAGVFGDTTGQLF